MYPILPPPPKDETGFLRKVVEVVNRIMDGKVNAVGTVTLTNSSTTTVVADPRCGAQTRPFLCPTNADASLEDWWLESTNGSFTIHHSSDTTTRTYSYVLLG